MAGIKESFSGISDSGSRISISNKKKKIFLFLIASFLLVASVIGIVAGVASRKNSSKIPSSAHAILKSSCSSTLYPDLCYSAIATVPGAADNLSTQKDVIEISLNITTTAVEHNYFTIKKLLAHEKLTEREKTALHDCLEMVDETLDELHETAEDLKQYPNKKSLDEHAEDLKILLSAAMTNQDTCIDGFSHEQADKEVRNALLKGQEHVYHMCSNALAMIKNMTDTDMAEEKLKMGRKLGESTGEIDGFPGWLSAGDRRLLQASTVTPDVTVASDGSGNYKTVSEAVAAAPINSNKRYIIRIKAGVYKENVDVSKKKKNIMFVGDGRKNTIITGSRNVVDGSTTFHSATVGQ
uniref:Pectinesterase n=1 Tax=Nelumbo nucifera TaxID=4432 RepID=A0A822ZW21_NELNU|nr:TPA_asm: hypothetical protein HUJ06_019140 [Nelumbo nucifera]